jgi:dihydroorotase
MQNLDHSAWPEHIRETTQEDQMRAHVARMTDADMVFIDTIVETLRQRYPALRIEFEIG